jgi:hypothetical protein
MKRIFTTLLLAVTMIAANAQNDMVKLNLFGLAFTNISLQYEHSLNTHSSVALGFSILPSRSFPTFGVKQDGASADDYDIKTLKISGLSITPEYRYYFSNKGPKGFYAAGYFRYAKYSLDNFVVNYASVSGGPNDRATMVSGDYKATLVGIMFGAQWTLGDNWVLDWWILGAGFGSQKASISGTGQFSADNQADIKESIADIDMPGIDLTTTVTSSSVTVDYKSTLPAFRGFGLCLGYRF